MSKKNEEVQFVRIESIAAEGKGIARIENKVVFVEKVAPGDLVDIKIIRKNKNFAEAVPLRFHELSSDRKDACCSHYGTCGGCSWQHIKYETQTDIKRQQVIDALQRIAKVPHPEVKPTIAADAELYYRNKLEFTFSNKKWLTREEIATGEVHDRDALGFHVPKMFDKVIDVEHCYLQQEPSNSIRHAVKEYCKNSEMEFYDFLKHEGTLRNLIIRTASTGEVMVIVQFAKETPENQKLLNFLKEKFPAITSLQYIINTKKNETYLDVDVKLFYGLPYITERMENLQFRIGPKSFYQTNSAQAYKLYSVARELAAISPNDTVYDLYTGTGTIALFISKLAKKVVGIEYLAEAIEDAKINASINQIDNVSFYAGDMKRILTDDFILQNGKPEVIITDPPRAGMDAGVVEMLLKVAPDRIVYVSCNPATQARDLALLNQKYEITAVQPVDMFPQTPHVENIIGLKIR